MPEGPIVCNAGPLIALSTIDQLDLLRALYDRVCVPEAVVREIVESGAGRKIWTHMDPKASGRLTAPRVDRG